MTTLLEIAGDFVADHGQLFSKAAFASLPNSMLSHLMFKLSAADLDRLEDVLTSRDFNVDSAWRRHCEALGKLRWRRIEDDFGEMKYMTSYKSIYHYRQFHRLLVLLIMQQRQPTEQSTSTPLYVYNLALKNLTHFIESPPMNIENCLSSSKTFLLKCSKYCEKLVLNGNYIRYIVSDEDLLKEVMKYLKFLTITVFSKVSWKDTKRFLEVLVTRGFVEQIALPGHSISSLAEEDLSELMAICSGCRCYTNSCPPMHSKESDVRADSSESGSSQSGACVRTVSMETGVQGVSMDSSVRGVSMETGVQGVSMESSVRGVSMESSVRGVSMESSVRGVSMETGIQGGSMESSVQGVSMEDNVQVSCADTVKSLKRKPDRHNDPLDEVAREGKEHEQNDRTFSRKERKTTLNCHGQSSSVVRQTAGRTGCARLQPEESEEGQAVLSNRVHHSMRTLENDEICTITLSVNSQSVATQPRLCDPRLRLGPSCSHRTVATHSGEGTARCSGGVQGFIINGNIGKSAAAKTISGVLPHWTNLRRLSVYLNKELKDTILTLIGNGQLTHLVLDTTMRSSVFESLVKEFSEQFSLDNLRRSKPMELCQISGANRLVCIRQPWIIRKKLSAVQVLDLSGNQFGEQAFSLLLSFIDADTALKCLKLNSCNLRSSQSTAVLRVLNQRDSGLEALSFSGNQMDGDGCGPILLQFLQHNTSLKRLFLANVRLSSGLDNCPELVSALASHPTLEVLDVGRNHLGTSRQKLSLLERILSTSTAMKDLNMEINQYKGRELIESADRVANSCCGHPHKLDTLHLSNNLFTVDEQDPLRERFCQFSDHVLVLCTGIYRESLEHLAQM